MIIQYNETYHVQIFNDTTECYDLVSKYAKLKFNEQHENYRMTGGVNWSLGSMLMNNKFDGSYYIAYKNNEPVGFAGVRDYAMLGEGFKPGKILLARAFMARALFEPILYGLMIWAQLLLNPDGVKYITIHDPRWLKTSSLYKTEHLSSRNNTLFALGVHHNSLFSNHITTTFNTVEQLVMIYEQY